jgi:hypothetical protein
MDTSLSAIFDLYMFPTGRRLFAHGQVAKQAKATKDADLVKHCHAAIAEDRKCLASERRWAGVAAAARGKIPASPSPTADATKIDPLVDRTLTAIRDHAESQRAGTAEEDPINAIVATFVATIFPVGVQAVTSLPYVEELSAVEDILERLQGAELSPVVKELGLERLVTRLAGHTERYRAALLAPAAETIAFGDVRAARAVGQERLLQTVAIIVGKHFRNTQEDVAARAALLGPILLQSAAIGEAMRARSTAADVDPETGDADPNGTAQAPVGAADPAEGGSAAAKKDG